MKITVFYCNVFLKCIFPLMAELNAENNSSDYYYYLL